MYLTTVKKETAYLLKQCGMPTLYMMGYVTKYYHRKTGTLLALGRTGRIKLKDLIFAPVIEEAVRWIEIKYKIFCTATPYLNAKDQLEFDSVIYGIDFKDENDLTIKFTSKEAALEDAVQHACKEILSVKS